jgi:hypothetical protein
VDFALILFFLEREAEVEQNDDDTLQLMMMTMMMIRSSTINVTICPAAWIDHG